MACFGPLAALSLNSVEKCVRFSNLLIYPYPAKCKIWVVKSWQYFQLFLTFSNPIWIIVLSAQNWYFKLLRKIYFQDHYKKCSRIIFWNVLSARSFLQCFRSPSLTFDVIVQLTIDDCIFKRFQLGEFLRSWSLNNISTRKHKRCLPWTIGTLRCKNGDGNENVTEKGNSRFFKLRCHYSKSLTLLKCRRTLMDLKEISSLLVYVHLETWN